MKPGQYANCWLAQFSTEPCRLRADGRFDRIHLIPKQRIRIALRSRGYSAQEINDAAMAEGIIKLACRNHHSHFDNRVPASKAIYLRAEDYPASVGVWAERHGFYFHSARSGWLAYHRPEAA